MAVDWILSNLWSRRRAGSSQRAMLEGEGQEEAPQGVDHDRAPSLAAQEEGKAASEPGKRAGGPHVNGGTAVHGQRPPGEEEEHFPPPPVSSSQVSFLESVHTIIDELDRKIHMLPKWEYYTLVGLVIVLAVFLGLLLVISLIYGFGLDYPHISVVATQPMSASLIDPQGSVPLRSTIEFANDNMFPIYARPSHVDIFTDAARQHKLGTAQVGAVFLHAHEKNHLASTEYTIHKIGDIPGGKELTQAVLQGKPTTFYTASTISLRVKGFGLIPIIRKYRVECRVLKLWGKPEQGGDDSTVADCNGKFLRSI